MKTTVIALSKKAKNIVKKVFYGENVNITEKTIPIRLFMLLTR